MGSAARRWAEELAGWAIPEHIVAGAPESPWGFPPELWTAPAPDDCVDTPSKRRALEALPPGGTVLDVGAGGGAGSLALVPPAELVVGVDESEGMLANFGAAAEARGVAHLEVLGRWPGVAAKTPVADVVVCHHVFYNVADLVPFAEALTDHARERVVVELTAEHPMAAQRELWRHFHALERPSGPTAGDALAVLGDAGLDVSAESFTAPPRAATRPEWLAFLRKRLCLPVEREPELAAILAGREVRSRQVVAVWWRGRGVDRTAGGR